jgi:Acyl-CoA reductase (LuxC)
MKYASVPAGGPPDRSPIDPADRATASVSSPGEISAAAPALRAAAADESGLSRHERASILAEVCSELGRGSAPPARALNAQIAANTGYSEELLAASIAALTAPFTSDAHLDAFARRLRARRDLVGFLLPGNIPGAGLHEIILALLAGCAVMVKTATSEPCFFREFAGALMRRAPAFASRISVLNWSRTDTEMTAALRQSCDRIAVFGDDATIATLDDTSATLDDTAATLNDFSGRRDAEDGDDGRRFAGFGDRVSGAIVADDKNGADGLGDGLAGLLARDITLFEQRGCLSPHHIFVEDSDGSRASAVAAQIAAALDGLACALPPPRRLGLEHSAAIRRVRETARWRGLGGKAVRLWEGPALGWTVVYDADADFTPSPGFRTVSVSPFVGLPDLERRLAPVSGRLEAFAIAGHPRSGDAQIRAMLEKSGVSYICAPGAMQSPPLEWPHGGGAFLRSFLPAAEACSNR